MARVRKSQRLIVFQNSKRVGILNRAPSGAISFHYLSSWLDDKSNFPISLSLPLQEEAFKGAQVSAFFDNLLPDNVEIRNKVAQRVKAESAKTFDLLHAI